MGEITLSPGDSAKIISQPPRGNRYNIAVDGADVWLSHNSAGIKRSGKRVRPGDRVTLQNLEGTSVFAVNPPGNTTDATVYADEASFDLIFQPRAVQASVQTSSDSESAPATDNFTNVTAAGVDIGSGGSSTEQLDPPGRSEQISIHVEGTSSFEVTVAWENTSESYVSGGGSVKQVLPVYYIDTLVDITITDTSGGANTVDYDIAVV